MLDRADPKIGHPTGNYTKLFNKWGLKGVPLGKVSVFAGESESGKKSFICAGNLVKNAQEQGCPQVVVFDSENALDEEWLQALDVDTSPEKLPKLVLA